MTEKYTIEVKKRTWYQWVLWALWLFVSIATLQTAVASGAELEPRSAVISWVVFFVLLVAGGVVWYMRRDK
ncbi:MAG: hypothetical protein IMY76_04355 [Chloroflexi bacterium]|nr:hypothetical protein [Chloroflexota bacterium]